MCLSEPIEIAWRKYLSFYLSHHPIRDKSLNLRYTLNEAFTSTETIVGYEVQLYIFDMKPFTAPPPLSRI